MPQLTEYENEFKSAVEAGSVAYVSQNVGNISNVVLKKCLGLVNTALKNLARASKGSDYSRVEEDFKEIRNIISNAIES